MSWDGIHHASKPTPEVEFSRSLTRGGSMRKFRFTDSQIPTVLKHVMTQQILYRSDR